MTTFDRDALGRLVRETWVAWAREQPDVADHPSWLVGWDGLPERDREVDRRIGRAVVGAVRGADLLLGDRPPVSAAIDAWHQACHDGATIEDGMRRVVDAVRAADMPPLAELVTDDDLDAAGAARRAYFTAHADSTAADIERAALEAYGARLLARHGRTP